MQITRNFMLINNHKTFLTKSLYIKITSCFVSSVIAKVVPQIYKGVPGSFTLSDKLFDTLNQNKAAFNFTLYNYVQAFKYPLNPTKPMEQQIYDMTSYWTTKHSFWYNNQFKSYENLLPEAPYGIMLPFNQHFISHIFKNKVLDITRIKLDPNNVSIDFSAFKNTGVTLQHLFEIRSFQQSVQGLNDYFKKNYPNDCLEFKAINPSLQATGKTFQNKDIQPNNDFVGTIQFHNLNIERQFPADVKTIIYVMTKSSLVTGNFLNTPVYSFKIHLDRLLGFLKNYNGHDRSLDAFNVWVSFLTKMSNSVKKKLSPEETLALQQSFQNELYGVLCNTDFKDIFPSIIKEIPYEDHTAYDNEIGHTINDILQKRRVHVQEYFPPMGKETADYGFHIEKFIKELPVQEVKQIEPTYVLLSEYLSKLLP